MINTVTDYKAVRLQIKTGDLFFTGSNSMVSGIIKFFTQSDDAHVGVFLWLEDRLFIAESTEGRGCQMLLASSKLKDDPFVWAATHRTEDQMVTIKQKIFNDIGRVQYDLSGAILSLFWDTKSSRQFCSEWAAYVLGWKFTHLRRGLFPSDLRTAASNKN